MESRSHARQAGLTTQAAAARDLRAARAAALARRGGGAARFDAGVDHLVCECNAERFGLPMAAVAQVLPMRPCTPVPGAVPALVGLAALSGRIVGVLSLARALGRPDPASETDGTAGHLVVLRGGQSSSRPLALAVDRVLGIARVADPPAAPQDGADRGGLGNGATSGYAPGAMEHGRPDFVVIDLPRLLHRVLP
jgi:purine-binding chemotaxis protein CheW